jgi:hypothetical protein
MTDWNLKSVDLDDLDAIDMAEFVQPWDDEPDVQGDEVSTAKGLRTDLSHFRRGKRYTADLRAKPDAVKHLERLPTDGESFHAVISGKYALWDLVPAMLEKIAPSTIDALTLATLSFSKQNAADMLALLDNGSIRTVVLLVSHYFKSTNREIYDSLIPQLLERGHKVCAMRTHAKLTLMQTTAGAKYVIESSANLRSCKNVEQFVMTQDANLYDFHRQWITDLIDGKGIHGWKAEM